MKKLYLVGIGLGNAQTLTGQGRWAIENSDLLMGAERMVDSFPRARGAKHHAVAAAEIMEYISRHPHYQTIAVLLSGDVGFYSGAKMLNGLIEEQKQAGGWTDYEVEFIPGISSLQYFCAKLKLSWEDARLVSLHGRTGNIMGEVWNHAKTFFLTGGEYSARSICRILTENDLGEVLVHVGERLSYPEERIITGKAEALAREQFHPLSVVLVENAKLLPRHIVTHGIEDRCFVRGRTPMTKSEIRSVALSKLQLRPADIVYDIGAGTGAAAIDIALQVSAGRVYAIEVNEEAVALIRTNIEQLEAWNVKVVPGSAPEALAALPAPDKAFIGGSGGLLAEILKLLTAKNPGIRVVVSAVTLETLAEAADNFRKLGFEDIDIVQIAAARANPVGKYHMMTGMNPVFIISGQKKAGRCSQP